LWLGSVRGGVIRGKVGSANQSTLPISFPGYFLALEMNFGRQQFRSRRCARAAPEKEAGAYSKIQIELAKSVSFTYKIRKMQIICLNVHKNKFYLSMQNAYVFTQ
jgi:hypothetical protein